MSLGFACGKLSWTQRGGRLAGLIPATRCDGFLEDFGGAVRYRPLVSEERAVADQTVVILRGRW